MVTEMCVGFIYHRLHGNQQWSIDVVFHLLVYGVLSVAYYKTSMEGIPYYLHYIKNYPFFVFGVWFIRYPRLKETVLSSRTLFSASVVLFFVSLWLQQATKMPIKLTGFFGIVVFVNLFAAYGDRIRNELSVIGRYSLQIYVFHWFLIPSLLPIGAWFLRQEAPLSGLPNENIVLMLLSALLIALPIVAACMVMGKIVKHSYWLNVLLFGGK